MAVYVDEMRAPYRGMVMCHMMADSTEELTAMAALIGVSRRWLQKAGSRHEHFDICLAKRVLAVKAGAIELTQRELAARMLVLPHHGNRALSERRSRRIATAEGGTASVVPPQNAFGFAQAGDREPDHVGLVDAEFGGK